MIGPQAARPVSAHSAAQATDSTPPNRLAAVIQARVDMFRFPSALLDPNQARHAPGGAVAAIRIKALALGVGAIAAAVDPEHAAPREAPARERIQVGAELARPARRKRA